MRYQGIQTFIIAPDKAHEMLRACHQIGGSFIRISPGAKSCINIMEIRPVVNPIAELLDEAETVEGDSWLTQKTSQLLTFFHILIPDLTNEEEQLVDEAIIKTYHMFGITHDNESVYVPGTKELRPMPIIGDLYDVLKDNPDTRRISIILGRFVTGSAASFNRQTNVDLTNKFIVFDLQDLQGTMKAVGMFIVMDFLWTRIKANRTEKKAILIDEGWQLIGASSDSRAADFVYRIFKVIRGYGGSAIFATQDISDLFAFQDGKYGKAIISNSKIKIVLGMEQQEARCVQDVLQLTENEVRNIVNFTRGEALICANNNKVPVFIRASKLEEELITTDPAQLRNIIQRKQVEQSAMTKLSHAEGKASRKKTQEQYEKDATMGVWAMEQLAANEVVRDENGEIDTFQPDVMTRTESTPETEKLAELFTSADEKSSQKAGANIGEKRLEELEDEDLVNAPDLDANDYSRKKEGSTRYDSHPPAEF